MKEFENDWVREVYDHSDEVDPGGELHWPSLKLGWALGKGMTVDNAVDFSRKGAV